MLRFRVYLSALTIILFLTACGGGGGGAGDGLGSIVLPRPPIPPPSSGFFTTDVDHFVTGTPDGAVTGYAKDGYYITKLENAKPVGSVPMNDFYARYAFIIPGLQPGDNQVDVACVNINTGAVAAHKLVTITYTPHLSTSNHRLVASSAGGKFQTQQSVIIDADTNLPVGAFAPRNGFALCKDPARSVVYHDANGELHRYDAATFTEGPLIGQWVVPGWVSDDGNIILGQSPISSPGNPDWIVLKASSGRVLAQSSYYEPLAVSSNGRYIAGITFVVGTSQRYNLYLMDTQTEVKADLGTVHVGLYTTPPWIVVTNQGEIMISSYAFATGNILATGPLGRNPQETTGLQDFMGQIIYSSQQAYVGSSGNPVIGHPATYQVDIAAQQVRTIADHQLVPDGMSAAGEGRAFCEFSLNYNSQPLTCGALYSVPGFKKIGADFMLPMTGSSSFSFARFP